MSKESDIIFPVRKRPRRLIIEDEPDDEDSEYRLRMAEGILQTVPSQNYNWQGSLSNGDIYEARSATLGQFPKHIDPTPSKKNPTRTCKVCTKHKKRSETTWECKKCRVALHVPNCFERYHTVEDY